VFVFALSHLKGREGLLRVEVEVFCSLILANFCSFLIYWIVSVVTAFWLDRPGIVVRFRAGAIDIYFLQSIVTGL